MTTKHRQFLQSKTNDKKHCQFFAHPVTAHLQFGLFVTPPPPPALRWWLQVVPTEIHTCPLISSQFVEINIAPFTWSVPQRIIASYCLTSSHQGQIFYSFVACRHKIVKFCWKWNKIMFVLFLSGHISALNFRSWGHRLFELYSCGGGDGTWDMRWWDLIETCDMPAWLVGCILLSLFL